MVRIKLKVSASVGVVAVLGVAGLAQPAAAHECVVSPGVLQSADEVQGTSGPDDIDCSSTSHEHDIFGFAGADDILASENEAGFEFLSGGNGPDRIAGLAGDEFMSGDAGNDLMGGGEDDDDLSGGPGDDGMSGGGGDDDVGYEDAAGPVFVSLNRGVARGGGGSDTLQNFENVDGSNFADVLVGDAQDNTLFGNDGDDRLFGLDGDDLLGGNDGLDRANGGAHIVGDACDAEVRVDCEG